MSTRTLNLCLWVQSDDGSWASTCQAVPTVRVSSLANVATYEGTLELLRLLDAPRCPLCGRIMREMHRYPDRGADSPGLA